MGERWRVLRDDEDYGPGCYEVGLTAEGYGPHPAPPEGDSILVMEKWKARALRAEEAVRAEHRYKAALGGAPCSCEFCQIEGSNDG